ncbi:MAG: diaminopimelate epimerase [Methylococcaceae bacterium]
MHGLGNDFVVFNGINQSINFTQNQLRHIADRHYGIGCDQILLVEAPISSDADFRYRIFNADGSEVAQCGNGARCFARFVHDKNLTDKNPILVDTESQQLLLHLSKDNQVTVDMGVPKFEPAEIPISAQPNTGLYELTIGQQTYQFGAVSMGNPHAVLLVDDINSAPVNTLGSAMEQHSIFPERANIGFMAILDRQHIAVRVFERGAGETLACGSGACAAIAIGVERDLLDNHVTVRLTGGELSLVWPGRQHSVMMTGPATSVFDGIIRI